MRVGIYVGVTLFNVDRPCQTAGSFNCVIDYRYNLNHFTDVNSDIVFVWRTLNVDVRDFIGL